jgi:hypothetical protein
MDADKVINVDENEFDESQQYDNDNEDEFLEKRENYLGNLVLRTRSILFNQLKRVTFIYNLKNLNFTILLINLIH